MLMEAVNFPTFIPPEAVNVYVPGVLVSSFGREPADVIILAGAEYVDALRGLSSQTRQSPLRWTLTLPFGNGL